MADPTLRQIGLNVVYEGIPPKGDGPVQYPALLEAKSIGDLADGNWNLETKPTDDPDQSWGRAE